MTEVCGNPYEVNRFGSTGGGGGPSRRHIFVDPRALSLYLPTRCEPFFKARGRSPWRMRNPSRPSGTKRHPRRPGTLNTDTLGATLTRDASKRHVEHQLV
jgi:hypothetical protein